jgi:hypothetical protein
MRQDRQHSGDESEREHASVALANTEVDGKRVDGAEQEDESPVACVLRVVHQDAADRDEKGTEEACPGSHQPPGDKVQRWNRQHSENRRQKPQAKLVERHQRPHHVIVQEIHQGAGIPEARLDDGVTVSEDLSGFKTPVPQAPESKQGGDHDDAEEQQRMPAASVRVLRRSRHPECHSNPLISCLITPATAGNRDLLGRNRRRAKMFAGEASNRKAVERRPTSHPGGAGSRAGSSA